MPLKANTLQKFCRGCSRVLELAKFPAHVDMNTRCLDCTSGRIAPQTSASVTTPAQAQRAKPGYPRRNGKDKRE